MDHHCPFPLRCVLICSWISNCVGARNQKPFMLFLLYVALDELLAVLMTVKYFIFYVDRYHRYVHWIPFHYLFPGLTSWKRLHGFLLRYHIYFPYFEDDYLPQVLVFVQGLFSALFLIFCIVLFWDQLKNIWYDRTFVEESQARIDGLETTNTFYESWKKTMAEPFCLRWFLPLEGKDMDKIINDLCHQMILDDIHEKRECSVSCKHDTLCHNQNELISFPMSSKSFSFPANSKTHLYLQIAAFQNHHPALLVLQACRPFSF